MSTQQALTLADLPKDVLTVIFLYLDVKTLGAVDMSSKFLSGSTEPAWALREITCGKAASKFTDNVNLSKEQDHVTSLQMSKDQSLSPKQRLGRFFVARSYCRRMQHLACRHFDFKNDGINRCLCTGCNDFPDLFTGAFGDGGEDYDFFVRIAYQGLDCFVMWEDFVPGQVGRAPDELHFDMAEIYEKGGLPWPFDYLEAFLQDPFHHNLYNIFGTVAVTVAAIKRNDPKATPQLVIATGGLHAAQHMPADEGDRDLLRVFQNPRFDISHKTGRLMEGEPIRIAFFDFDRIHAEGEASSVYSFAGLSVANGRITQLEN